MPIPTSYNPALHTNTNPSQPNTSQPNKRNQHNLTKPTNQPTEPTYRTQPNPPKKKAAERNPIKTNLIFNKRL